MFCPMPNANSVFVSSLLFYKLIRKNIFYFILIYFLSSSSMVFAQANKSPAPPKQAVAKRIDTNIKIDGLLDESIWQEVATIENFVDLEPLAGKAAAAKTKVKMAYDNTALYISAYMEELGGRDSVMRELSKRDDFGNTDWFGVFMSPYRDGSNGFGFILASTGVQFDAKYSNGGNEDPSWDAVWSSAVAILDNGWSMEMKIPYSAIRFPDDKEQVWSINFGRQRARTGEKSFWNPIDPQVTGFLTQFGEISGIKDIKSPVRLSATPYASVYAQNYYDKNAAKKSSNSYSYSAGMDVKYGINDAFTLDMTLIPDFGQVQSDDQVLNLSPFEIQFSENRPFFTEGTELFNKGNLFYSRRVGGTPLGHDIAYEQTQEGENVIENPHETQLYNATKLSGRTTNGLGVGVLNAVSAEERATIENTTTGDRRTFVTSPLANYNVFVLDQNLKNSSSVSFINTNVWRSGNQYHDANVTGAYFNLRNKKLTYGMSGGGSLSQQYYKNLDNVFGYKYNLSLRKLSGSVTYGIDYYEESKNYNPNDLGILFAPNERVLSGYVNYSRFKEWWKFNAFEAGINSSYNRLHTPSKYANFGMEVWAWARTKQLWNFNAWTYVEPIKTYDFFEPRREGRYYTFPTNWNTGININSDSRKRYIFGISTNFRKFNEEGRRNFNWYYSQRYRFSNKFSLSLSTGNTNFLNDVGFFDNSGDDIIFSKRHSISVQNVLGGNYLFNNLMGLSLRVRHNWQKVQFKSFHRLDDEGLLQPTNYVGSKGLDFHAFTVDMVYTWRFAPGSDVSIVWKNAILGLNRNAVNDYGDWDYFQAANGLGELPQNNSISLRVVYFLDYLDLRRKKHS